jgi:hypothetical protein
MKIGSGLAHPKPERRATVKGRDKREEGRVLATVRAVVFARDRWCRAWRDVEGAGLSIGPCCGPHELMHLKKRSATRGMAPHDRHDASWCVRGCARHHAMEEGRQRPRLRWQYLTEAGANGPMSWRVER